MNTSPTPEQHAKALLSDMNEWVIEHECWVAVEGDAREQVCGPGEMGADGMITLYTYEQDEPYRWTPEQFITVLYPLG